MTFGISGWGAVMCCLLHYWTRYKRIGYHYDNGDIVSTYLCSACGVQRTFVH